MFNQHAKWLEKAKTEVPWRAAVPSLNLLITSTSVAAGSQWLHPSGPRISRRSHKQKARRSPRIYLPPDANCLLSIADHCLRSTNYVNVIVADKQPHLQYLNMDAAIKHCAKGIGVWDWASNDQGLEPDVVMASAGDIATMEALAATAILREKLPDLKIRFVNVLDLFRLLPPSAHPHGLPDRDFDTLFTADRPVIFNFHAYPTLIHKLAYSRRNHGNLHVHGYREKGSINTPLELAILNKIDRFNLAIDVIDRVEKLSVRGAHLKEWLKDQISESINYAFENGIDKPEIRDWKWPY